MVRPSQQIDMGYEVGDPNAELESTTCGVLQRRVDYSGLVPSLTESPQHCLHIIAYIDDRRLAIALPNPGVPVRHISRRDTFCGC